MGGLLRRMPETGAAFLVATAAITGIVPLAGFFSKDAILSDGAQHRKLDRPVGTPDFLRPGKLGCSGHRLLHVPTGTPDLLWRSAHRESRACARSFLGR